MTTDLRSYLTDRRHAIAFAGPTDGTTTLETLAALPKGHAPVSAAHLDGTTLPSDQPLPPDVSLVRRARRPEDSGDHPAEDGRRPKAVRGRRGRRKPNITERRAR